MSDPLALGPFRFDAAGSALTRDSATVPLGGRALAVLTALAETEGTATKEALLDRAWPGVTVEEGNLTVQIAALRKLLGDDAIVTVPRVGYRLRRDRPLPEAAGLPRIAVLPFATLGSGAEDGYLADGIAEDIITALGRFREFVVLSRQAAEVHRAELATHGVRYAVEGSLRRAGDRLRVSARLTETADGTQLWARNFDGTSADLFDMQDRITEAVVGAIAPEVQTAEYRSARQRPASTEAYDLYLRALAAHETSTYAGSGQAFDLLSRAIAAEPDNPIYLAGLSWVLQFRPMSGWDDLTGDDPATCRDLALRALSIGTTNARALSYCANALLHSSRDFDLAMSTARRALAANPNMMHVVVTVSITELHLGDLAVADELAVRALALSPADPMRFLPLIARAHVAIVEGRPADALPFAAESLALSLSYAPTHWMLIAANALTGRMDEARQACVRLQAAIPGTTIASIRRGQPKKLPERIEPVLDGLRLAGLPED